MTHVPHHQRWRIGAPSARTGLSRRSLLRGAMAGGGFLAAGALAGCGSVRRAAANEPLVRVWDRLSGAGGKLRDEMLDDVRAEAPDITIDRTTLAWGPPYYTKLAMASAGGRAPETAVIHRSEEHTSELQSRGHLVCRLLLEKKKIHLCYPDVRWVLVA